MASQTDGKVHELVYGSAAKLLAPGARDLGIIASTRDFPPDVERKLERHRAYTKYAPVPNAIRYIMGHITGKDSGFIELTRVVLGIDHTGRPIPFVRHILLPQGSPDKRSGLLMGAINDNADPRQALVKWIDPSPQFAEKQMAPPLAQAGEDFIKVLVAVADTVTRYGQEKRPVLLVQSKPDTGPESATFMQMLRLIALVGNLLPDNSLDSWVAATHVIEESDRPYDAVILSTYAGTPFHSVMTSRQGSRRPLIVDMEKLTVEGSKYSMFSHQTNAAIRENKPSHFAEKCNQFKPSPSNYDSMGKILEAESLLAKNPNLQNVEELAKLAKKVEAALDSPSVEIELGSGAKVDSNDKDFLKSILKNLNENMEKSLTKRWGDQCSIIEKAFRGVDVPKVANLLFKYHFLRDPTKKHLLEALSHLNDLEDGKNKLAMLLEKCEYLQKPVIGHVLDKIKGGDKEFAELLDNCTFLKKKDDIIDLMVEEIVEHPGELRCLLEKLDFLQKPVMDYVLLIKNPENKLAELFKESPKFLKLAFDAGVIYLNKHNRKFAEIIAGAIKKNKNTKEKVKEELHEIPEKMEFWYLINPNSLSFEPPEGIAKWLVLGLEILALLAGLVLFFYQFWRTPAQISVANPVPHAEVPSAVESSQQNNKTQNPAAKTPAGPAKTPAGPAKTPAGPAKTPETPEITAPAPQPAPTSSAKVSGSLDWFLAPVNYCYGVIKNAPARFGFSFVLLSCIFLIWFNKDSISKKLFAWFRDQKQWRDTIPGYAPLLSMAVFLASLAFVVLA